VGHDGRYSRLDTWKEKKCDRDPIDEMARNWPHSGHECMWPSSEDGSPEEEEEERGLRAVLLT
jgi:hypothetical protein